MACHYLQYFTHWATLFLYSGELSFLKCASLSGGVAVLPVCAFMAI
jgi:hypothetical protein